MRVIKNGQPTQMTYEEVCKDLGFIAGVKFVEVSTRGSITFTCGRPSEIRALYSAVLSNGYKPTRKFTQRMQSL